MKKSLTTLASFILIGMCLQPLSAAAQGAAENMSFFVTSAGSGDGADLGGLAGADAHCQSLAEAAGAGDDTWRAYLSASQAVASGENEEEFQHGA